MNEPILAKISELFLALSDKTRLRLIGLMADGPVAVGFLADSIGESQPKVSRHLAYLRNAGLVSTRREGKNIYYGIEWPDDEMAAAILREITGMRTAMVRADRGKATYISAETDVREYVPQEIEIYLL